jgi:hypothetical protein
MLFLLPSFFFLSFPYLVCLPFFLRVTKCRLPLPTVLYVELPILRAEFDLRITVCYLDVAASIPSFPRLYSEGYIRGKLKFENVVDKKYRSVFWFRECRVNCVVLWRRITLVHKNMDRGFTVQENARHPVIGLKRIVWINENTGNSTINIKIHKPY